MSWYLFHIHCPFSSMSSDPSSLMHTLSKWTPFPHTIALNFSQRSLASDLGHLSLLTCFGFGLLQGIPELRDFKLMAFA